MYQRSPLCLLRSFRRDAQSIIQTSKTASQRWAGRRDTRVGRASEQERCYSLAASDAFGLGILSNSTSASTKERTSSTEERSIVKDETKLEEGEGTPKAEDLVTWSAETVAHDQDQCDNERVSWRKAIRRAYSNNPSHIDYGKEFPLALARREPDLATMCLFAADHAKDGDFIRAIQPEDFTAVMKLVSPTTNWVSELIDIHWHMSNARVNWLGLMPLEEVARSCGANIVRLLDIRRQHAEDGGHGPLIEDYEIVLESAKTLRLALMAEEAWNSLHEDDIPLTTKCFNGYMAAKAYVRPIGASTRHGERVVPWALDHRRGDGWLRWYNAYAVGANGIREIGEQIFLEMQKMGLMPNVESYSNIITANGNEGDISSVSALLESVWGIDIHALKSGDEPCDPSIFPEGDQLRPDTEFLYATTRAYLINNDLATALRLMFYLCKHYNITADVRQWTLVLGWSHVLSVDRSEKEVRNGRASGKVDRSIVSMIWQTMTSPPYNIKPDVGMYHLLIKSFLRKDDVFSVEARERMVHYMQEGRQIYSESVKRRVSALKRLKELLGQQAGQRFDDEVLPMLSIENANREHELARLLRTRDRQLVEAWLHYLLVNSRFHAQIDFDARWTAVEIPVLLEKYRTFTPQVVQYDTPTGYVEIVLRTREEREVIKRNLSAERLEHVNSLRGRFSMSNDDWIGNNGLLDTAFEIGFAHTRTSDLNDRHKMYRGWRRPDSIVQSQHEQEKFDTIRNLFRLNGVDGNQYEYEEIQSDLERSAFGPHEIREDQQEQGQQGTEGDHARPAVFVQE